MDDNKCLKIWKDRGYVCSNKPLNTTMAYPLSVADGGRIAFSKYNHDFSQNPIRYTFSYDGQDKIESNILFKETSQSVFGAQQQVYHNTAEFQYLCVCDGAVEFQYFCVHTPIKALIIFVKCCYQF